MRLTKRDERLIGKLAVARWLTTGQVHRLFFSQASLDAARKRLRKLARARWLRSYQPHRMAEAVHTTGRRAVVFLEDKGINIHLEQRLPKHLEHLIGINEIRIAVESAGIPLAYFFAAWELSRLDWRYPIIPDAVFALDQGRRMTFAAEYDRGSETIEQFSRKIRLYEDYRQELNFDMVLIVSETQPRMKALSRYLSKRGLPARRYSVTTIVEIRQAGWLARFVGDWTGRESLKRDFFLTEQGLLSGSLAERKGLS